ncbi:response regulator [Terasakiella sp. A23]|uniref:response regulator n=1 Tax=Terasakiella sp. FCG-A23 TaxID=3080561 RepID=UPI002955C635|nr:response regulator [Terasakiella sp. A23]MDV7339080.1 response regulator [Terasakiella sp. A23]
MKIALVDDDKALIKTLSLVLEKAGHQVSVYHAATSAILDITDEQPDLVITDISMIGMDGLSLIEELRKAPQLSETSYIVISGNEGEGWEQKAIVAGARGYIPKPIDLETFPLQIIKIVRG